MKCKKNEICISFAKTVRPLAAMTKYESERLSHKYNLENNFFYKKNFHCVDAIWLIGLKIYLI
jgi:hypothetical protein